MAFDSQPLQDAFNAGRTLAPAALGTQVLIMSALSLVTLVLFNLLRPRNKIVYEPKVKYHVGDKAPPQISNDKFCGWLPPLIHTKEPELLDKIGLDAVAFFRFLSLMRGIFAGIAILTCCILIPINFAYTRAQVLPKKRDALSMLTIRNVKGNTLYALVASYLITILVIGSIYVHGRAMVKLRNEWFKLLEYVKSFYARTLSITNVPKYLQQDGGLSEILGKSSPYPLIEFHNQTVRDFEAVLVKYLKGSVHNKSRLVVTFGGICGVGEVHKDAIEYYTYGNTLIPLLLVAALANLDGQSWSGHSTITFAIASGVVPPAVSGIFTVFLPRIVRWLGKYQGALTRARLERAVVARYFAFLVISQLIPLPPDSVFELVDLFGRHAYLKEIIANLDKLPGRIARTYINTSTYWLKFFPCVVFNNKDVTCIYNLRAFLFVFDLTQIIYLLWISFKTRVFGRTPRDIREWTQAPTFEYAMILAIPPILMILIFKIFMNHKFNKNFHFYLSDEEELSAAHVHSIRADIVKHQLQNRFGHPALHAKLYLLRQVYGGKIEEEKGKVRDPNPNVEILDGLRITAIQQSNLQYDPVLYSRDFGEYDNDRSDADSVMLSPQSILFSSSGDQRQHSMLPSPPPQSYFNIRLSVPVQVPGHAEQRPLSMHTQDSSILPRPMSNVSQIQPHGAASYLQPYGIQHESLSIFAGLGNGATGIAPGVPRPPVGLRVFTRLGDAAPGVFASGRSLPAHTVPPADRHISPSHTAPKCTPQSECLGAWVSPR
ncbi:late exocytosis, associated with Golgi transport-domain-containing protein [Mycena epipterygia]|nr:late exocytosis, associated with Golgi transport-domain-containing protein [Mycena epipterygia]